MNARKLVLSSIALAVALAATGCASVRPELGQVPSKNSLNISRVFDDNAPAESEVHLDWSPESMYVLHPKTAVNAKLPNVAIANLSFSELGVQDALQLVAAKANLRIRIEGGSLGSQRYGPFAVENLSGSLSEVLDEMAQAAGFFWEVQGKTLVIRQDDQFVVNIPPVLSEDTMAGVANTLQYIGARDAYLDRAGKTITFTANRKSADRIQRYLENVRETRSLLVYDTHIFQVDLKDGMDTGIQWADYSRFADNGASRTSSALVNSTGFGLAIKTATFSMSSLVDFLSTQGTVKSLSSPQLTMLSGSKGAMRVGRTIKYVSKVGASTTTGVSQVTTETESLRTGLSLQLQGDVYDKTVFTRVNLSVADVAEMKNFTAVGTELVLPQTLDRDLDVSVRSRPGDVLLLGGIHVESDTTTSARGVAGFKDGQAKSSSELVLVMKARVVHFTSKPVATQAADSPEKQQ